MIPTPVVPDLPTQPHLLNQPVLPDRDDTLVALATAPMPAGVAVVRLSGPKAWGIAKKLSGRAELVHGQLHYCRLRDPAGKLLDRGYVVGFAAPRSFTGQDVVELHVHGSLAVVARIQDVCCEYGARPARAGEFTMRAVDHGKLDLVQAEALADLIAVRSEAGRQAALAHLDGALSTQLQALRQPVLRLLAEVEARLDFASEEDVGVLDRTAALQRLLGVQTEVQRLLSATASSRIRLRGARVALYGAPNAGKSTLFNRLCGRDRALVDARPGTTRDVLEADGLLGDVLVTWVDTAGLRWTTDPVEAAGTQRASAEAEQADVVLWLQDGSAAASTLAAPPVRTGAVLAVRTKADLAAESSLADHEVWGAALAVSAHTGTGLALLQQRIEQAVQTLEQPGPAGALLLRDRHVAGLQRASGALVAAGTALQEDWPLELAAGDLREAAEALGEILGVLTPDDVLGAIFSQFCIGK